MIKVYTKYDTVQTGIHVPRIMTIEPNELGYTHDMGESSSQSGYMTGDDYYVESVEDGLEGVKYVHYGTNNLEV